MSTTVNREELLHQLESMQPGISSREIIEQSSCFVFRKGFIRTFNDEVSCASPTTLPFTGAVKAEPLLAVLRKFSETEITLTEEENEIIIEGKRRKAGIRREAKVLLPVKNVEVPDDWKKMDPDWLEAITLVQHCASHDQSQFALTCVHIGPSYIEACDRFQVTRMNVKTGVEKNVLARAESLKNVPLLGMTKYCITGAWIHFKNPAGLVLSCRCYWDDYPDMLPFIEFKGGKPITIPKGLGEAADRASVFSKETSDDNQVLIQLKPGKLRIRGTGATGWFSETKSVKYDGPEMEFLIDPSLLMEITKRHSDAEIAEGRLRVNGGKWKYATSLGLVANPGEKKE